MIAAATGIERTRRCQEFSGRAGCPVEKGGATPPFFCKYVIRKGFKSFVLKVCESKGFADAFLQKCVILKELGQKSRELMVES